MEWTLLHYICLVVRLILKAICFTRFYLRISKDGFVDTNSHDAFCLRGKRGSTPFFFYFLNMCYFVLRLCAIGLAQKRPVTAFVFESQLNRTLLSHVLYYSTCKKKKNYKLHSSLTNGMTWTEMNSSAFICRCRPAEQWPDADAAGGRGHRREQAGPGRTHPGVQLWNASHQDELPGAQHPRDARPQLGHTGYM